jgi:hypothetical protein
MSFALRGAPCGDDADTTLRRLCGHHRNESSSKANANGKETLLHVCMISIDATDTAGVLEGCLSFLEADAMLGTIDALLLPVPSVSNHAADGSERRLSGDQPSIVCKCAAPGRPVPRDEVFLGLPIVSSGAARMARATLRKDRAAGQLLHRPRLGEEIVMPKFDDALRGYAHEVLKRDGFTCRYCGLDGSASFDNWLALSWDHLLPKGHAQRDNPEFIVTACHFCNYADNRYFEHAAGRGLLFDGLSRDELVAQRRPFVQATRNAYQEFWETSAAGGNHMRPRA